MSGGRRARWPLPVVAGLGAVSLAAATLAPAPPAAAAAIPTADTATSRYVVAISVDGLAPRVVRRMGSTALPAYARLRTRGASTPNARTVRASTSTLPNHTSMLTGWRVGGTQGHLLRVNRDIGGTLHDVAGRYVSSVFDVVHDHGGSTAMYAGKPKFDLLDRSWNGRNGRPDRVGPDDGRDKIDTYVRRASQRALVDRAIADLRSSPATFTFLHLAAPDRVGHEAGFGSTRYRAAVRRTDRQLSRLLSAIRDDPRLRGRTTVILTSDHGGIGRSHRDASRRANYTVPFYVWGRGVSPGTNLYAVNPDRRRPFASRTTYRGAQPVRNADLANLATDLLGLPDVPGSSINAPSSLDVARAG